MVASGSPNSLLTPRGVARAQVLKKAAEKKELVQVALNTHGTRAVQKLIETLTSREQVRGCTVHLLWAAHLYPIISRLPAPYQPPENLAHLCLGWGLPGDEEGHQANT